VVLLPSEVIIWRECIPLHHAADYRDKGDPAWICRLEGKYWVRFKEVGSFSSISFSLFFLSRCLLTCATLRLLLYYESIDIVSRFCNPCYLSAVCIIRRKRSFIALLSEIPKFGGNLRYDVIFATPKQ
jgi:hypothetical protein